MSVADPCGSVDEGTDDDQWIEQVEHEETIAPEAVNEEEVEEYIEVDGIVDDHDMQQTVLLRGDTVPRTLRNGADVFYAHVPTSSNDVSLNLPDLLSRTVTFTNGSKMFICFSKKCRKQLAFEGHLYNIDGFVKPSNWNFWRCVNPSCNGAIRTSPNITELRVRDSHRSTCTPDDVQIRLRITIYDLRLMAEFTEVPLDALYHAYMDKVMVEHNDLVDLFPPFEALKSNLEDHRANHTYRRRFALEARESDTNSIYFDLFVDNAAKFKRTKPFPPSLCMSCSAEFRSTPELPSQDQLLEHMFFDHGRKTSTISRFTFEDSELFEQWVRELQGHSKYRLKKMGIHDEHMYYLCQNDDRHFKSNHGRSSLVDMHCTAFIRVHDWRLVMRREMSEVVVDYCLDQYLHSELADSPKCKTIDVLFTPEVFMRDLAARRERTQQLIQDTGLQRVKRRAQPPSLTLNLSQRQGGCAAGDDLPRRLYGDTGEQSSEYADNGDNVFGASKSMQRQKAVQLILRNTSSPTVDARSKESYIPTYITRRENFADAETYNTVLQFEMTCDMLKERMQYARCIRAANHYLERLTGILDDVMADPECAPSSANDSLSEDSPSRDTNSSLSTAEASTSQKVPISSIDREVKLDNQSLPLRQKVLVRKGENGQLVVVKRTILGKVRKVVHDVESSTSEHPVEELPPAKATTSIDTEKNGQNDLLETDVKGGTSGDGPPIGDFLRNALYKSRTLGRDRALSLGVKKMVHENAAGQIAFNDDEDNVQTKTERLSDSSSQRNADSISARRPRGRPRKYP
ncbi:unnamed protein product [Cylicocyclus nassatus]|uniref:Uncharacterized protein n=1 Tax=Cylicocyclus nassatus TaxID=53992 RepID=A0AA36LYP2_CYLNA|nr:unnamed protein product [Cylicocyclus nassatus]